MFFWPFRPKRALPHLITIQNMRFGRENFFFRSAQTPEGNHACSYIYRPTQLAELSRSKLFSHSMYDNFFVTFATKVRYLTFCDKMRQFLIYRKWIERGEIKRKLGNVESESLSISSFSRHFLFIFLLSLHFHAAWLPGCHNLCNPAYIY